MTNRGEYPSAEGYVVYTCIYGIDQWEIQDPKMEVLYHLRHHETIFCVDIPLPGPYIGLIYGRYLRYLHQLWLSTGWLCQARSKTPKLWKRRRREAGRCWKGGIGVISHESYFFSHLLGRIVPTDSYVSEGWHNHQAECVSYFRSWSETKKSLVLLIAGYIPKGAARVCPRRHWKLPNPREAQAPPVLCRMEPGSPEWPVVICNMIDTLQMV